MARSKNSRKQKNQRKRGRRGFLRSAVLLAAICIGGFFGWMWFGAGTTHLKYADVYLDDLPAGFDGTTMLYVSDLNIRNAYDAAACGRLMNSLSVLQPEILLLGGDYSASTLLETLNGNETGDFNRAAQFISSLDSFPAPFGKFAVLGENDDAEALQSAFQSAGVQMLSDSCATVHKNGAQLVIAGMKDVSGGHADYEQVGGYFSGDECVITLAHNPSAYVGIRVAEARSGGSWADMVLSGHTLGGQIKIFDRTMRTLPEEEARCIAGWYYTGDIPMLVSQGVGCKGARLRLGTQSEVWLITLRRPAEVESSFDLPML